MTLCCSLVVIVCLYVCLCSDYIAAPGCQEDDVHNVQCVIDSLSLDYLQISLSHITGTINIFTNIAEIHKIILDPLSNKCRNSAWRLLLSMLGEKSFFLLVFVDY